MPSRGTGAYSAHIDTFTRDGLPPIERWPDMLLDRPQFAYPPRLNAAAELVDRWVSEGQGDRVAIRTTTETWTYAQVQERANRIANVLTGKLGVVPGNRVMLRAPNSPMMVAMLIGVWKAGAVSMPSMPLLRAKELSQMARKGRTKLALCDHRLIDEMDKARPLAPDLARIVPFGGHGPDDLIALMAQASPHFENCPTAADDVATIHFTSGTTGEPKAAMQFHRDLFATCDSYGRYVLEAKASDSFIGSPPLAFSFGLGCLLLFPFRVGASVVLLEQASPDNLVAAIRDLKPTICITAPTAYRAILNILQPGDLASLTTCVSAGEALPKAAFEAWKAATGIEILDGIGSTEMLHIFIGAPRGRIRAGATGTVVPCYEAKVIGEDGAELPDGTPGRLAVRGPTGCRYLADDRQTAYVRDGWNLTGDTYSRDADGYFWYQARSDDMIISAGYNIAGPEVESALLSHPAVSECGVVGAPDAERGMIVKAYIVLKPGHTGDASMMEALQAHVKAEVAPFKYPRSIVFLANLPRTETGKLQRFVLRNRAKSEAEGTTA